LASSIAAAAYSALSLEAFAADCCLAISSSSAAFSSRVLYLSFSASSRAS
jgi:hypothetical protein